MLRRLKSYGPKRSEIRPQWFVRPPSIRARHQSKVVPGAVVYGSPSISHPPMQASNSPKGRSAVAAPRRGDWYGHVIIFESRAAFHIGPASSSRTSAPASARTLAAMPPPAPDPTMHTSYTFGCRMICMAVYYPRTRGGHDQKRMRGTLVAGASLDHSVKAIWTPRPTATR